ncbi:MAG: hypothetical protein AAF266_00640 [Planctomycetota bacterium]
MLLACVVPAEEPPAPDLRELVEQLGHPVYEERLDARRRLSEQGLAAFDVIREARTNPDPEIAHACERLLDEVAESLVRSDDPAAVRRWLTAYAVSEPSDRLDVVSVLADLPGQQAVPALVRLARFDPSDNGAREAARAVLALPDDNRPDSRRAEERDAALVETIAELDAAYGPGQRPAARWLAVAADEAGNPGSKEIAERWAKFANRARLDYAKPRREASLEVVATLHWRWLNAALVADDTPGATAAIDALVALDPEDAIVRLGCAARWAADTDRWAVVETLIDTHDGLLDTKRGLYLLADVAARRGNAAEAARLAEQALESDLDENNVTVKEVLLGPRVTVAAELYEIGRTEWCLAEYTEAAKSSDKIDGRAAVAAWKLSNLLFDAERYVEAAVALTPITDAISKSRSAKGEYMQLPQVQRGLLPEAGTLISRRRFSEALSQRAVGDDKAQMKSLRKAIAAEPNDADVLIAMYRVPDPPVAFAADTKRRIAAMRRDFESDIWNSPTEADPFNQWAWLVSNTEGDFEKAVRYSRRSLQIAPDTAGYLDTLGRCLFSAGRIEEAVEVQRRAVELEPRLQVLARQLAEFEAALDAQQQDLP